MLSKVLLLLLVSNLLVKDCLNSDVNTCQDIHTSCDSKAESQRLQRMFENEIAKIVECIRNFLINPNFPNFPNFSLDPLELRILPLYFNTEAFSSSMVLREIYLGGLASFVLDKGTVTVNLLPPQARAEIDLSFEQIQLLTKYNGNLEIMDMIKIFGKGDVKYESIDSVEFDIIKLNYSMDLRNLKISLQVTIKPKQPFLHKVQVKVKLPSTTANISGLFNDEYMSDIVSRQMTKTLTLLAQEQENNLNELLNKWIQQFLDMQQKSLDFVHLFENIHREGFSCDAGSETTLKFLNSSINGIRSKMSDFEI